MPANNRLNVRDFIPVKEGKKYALRLREDLAEWIEENTTGSQNSVINFLVHVGIKQCHNILDHDSLYQTVNEENDRLDKT